MTAGPRGVIRLTETFPASAERVFDAWLSPEKVTRWFLPDAAERATRVEIDPRVGGSILIVSNHAGRAMEYTGRYLEIERPHRLSFTINNSALGKTVRVTVLIKPRGAGCLLTLTSRIEREPLRALAPLAALAPWRAEKGLRPRWPAVEAKAVLSLGLHLGMLLPIVLRVPELPPGAAFPPPLSMVTVDLGVGVGGEHPTPPSASAAPAPIQQSPAAASRPPPHTNTGRTTLPVPQPRISAQPIRTLHDHGPSDSPRGSRPLNALGAPSHATNGSDLTTPGGAAASEDGGVLRHRTGAAAQVEFLLEASCIGTISFSSDGGLGTYHGSQKVPVEGRFFRDEYGRTWIRFTLWLGAPWSLPVTITGSEIRWTGVYGSGYALRPVGNNHLTGFAGFNIDSAAKMDFTCAGSDGHPT
jgi:uncharacterized protein YndB with AHSA1/START domain